MIVTEKDDPSSTETSVGVAVRLSWHDEGVGVEDEPDDDPDDDPDDEGKISLTASTVTEGFEIVFVLALWVIPPPFRVISARFINFVGMLSSDQVSEVASSIVKVVVEVVCSVFSSHIIKLPCVKELLLRN